MSEYVEKRDNASITMNERASPDASSFRNLNAKLANPLAHISHEQLMEDAKIFAETHGLEELVSEFFNELLGTLVTVVRNL